MIDPMDTKTMNAELIAEKFHEAYERLAPSFGYTTREDTRAFDPDSANGKLMIAVCAEVFAPTPAVTVEQVMEVVAPFLMHKYQESECRTRLTNLLPK